MILTLSGSAATHCAPLYIHYNINPFLIHLYSPSQISLTSTGPAHWHSHSNSHRHCPRPLSGDPTFECDLCRKNPHRQQTVHPHANNEIHSFPLSTTAPSPLGRRFKQFNKVPKVGLALRGAKKAGVPAHELELRRWMQGTWVAYRIAWQSAETRFCL